MAIQSTELRAILTLQSDLVPKVAAIEAALGRLGSTGQRTGASMGQLAVGFGVGTIAANALIGAVSGIGGAFANAGKGALDLSSRLEQARIGFTTMLGSASAAQQMIGNLQSFAETTAFDFPGVQQVAQSFLAMGIEAKNVIPLVNDVSNALSAAGHGGDTDRLQRVGQSLAEIAAQGKITGEQLRELSRNGIAVLPLLADAFGKTTAEVRQMAENGEISADMFFKAFHSQVALHYGDIQAEQAKTWAVAASNVGDILGRLSTQTFKEFFDALTQGALLMNDFLHSERAAAWAADMKSAIHEVMAALAPLGKMLQDFVGGSGVPATIVAPKVTVGKGAPDEGTRANWIVPPEAIKSAKDYDAQIKAATADIHDTTEALTALGAQQQGLKDKIEDTTKVWDLRLTGLKDQQAAIGVEIEATKTHYEGILDPLNRMQAQLQRLGEDTKQSFAAILDPLKSQLFDVNRLISDSKAAYESVVRPIQSQIDAITKANAALAKQRDLVIRIADLNLRESQLKALGDPGKRGDIAARLQALQFAQDDLERQKELLDLANKKGENDKRISAVQTQLDANRAQQIKLEQEAANLVNRGLSEQNTKQGIVNDAAKTGLEIAQARADITTQKQLDPLQAQLDATQARLKAIVDPLEAQAAGLSRAIEDVGIKEAAALAPITAAQESVARKIQDTNQALQEALAPLEAASKAIAAQITAAEAGKAAALAPLKDELEALDRKSNALELHKKQQADLIAGWKDEKTAIAAAADEAKKLLPKLDLSGGAGDQVGASPGDATGTSPLAQFPKPPSGLAAGFKDLATQVEASAAAFDHLNVATSGGLLGSLGALATFLGSFAIVGVVTGWLKGLAAAVTGAGLAAVASQAFWAVWLLFVKASIETVQKEWDATDWPKIIADWNNGLAGIQAGIAAWRLDMTANMIKLRADWDAWNVERTAAWNKFWADLGPNMTTELDKHKAALDAQLATWGLDWEAWNITRTASWNKFWTGLAAGAQTGWDALTKWLQPAVEGIVKFFEPLANVLKMIGDAITKLPANPPAWLAGLMSLARGGGGGAQQVAFRPGQGSNPGWMGDGGPATAEALAIMGLGPQVGNEIESYIRAAADRLGIDGATAIRVALSEGGLSNPVRQSDVMNNGQREQSFGPFQLNINGGLGATAIAQGIDPRNPAQWREAVDFALKTVSQQGWGAFHGAAAAGIGNWQGVGSGGAAAAGAAVFANFTPPGPASMSQAQVATEAGLSADAAAAFCGPYAAMLFANAAGRYPTAQEAQMLAAKVGWTPGQGMAGIQSELALLQSMGLDAVQQAGTPANINAALGRGAPVAISTPLHYLEASGGTADGGLNVGATGTWLRGGKSVMTLAEIEALAGPLDGIITLQGQLTTAQNAGAQAAAVQANANQQLGAILANGGRVTAGAAGLVNVLGAAQVQATDWAKVFAQQQLALTQTLEGQAPAGRNAVDAMSAFRDVLGPIERDIAGGRISLSTLEFKMLDLARATGVATAPWDRFTSGAEDSSAAMSELIDSTAKLSPAFQAVADYQHTAGSDSEQAAVRWFNAAQAYNNAKTELANAPVVPPVPVLPATPAGAVAAAPATLDTGPIKAVSAAWDETKTKADAAGLSVKAYEDIIAALDAAKITEQTDALGKVTDAVNTLSDDAHSFADWLDGHTFEFHAKFPDIPSDFQSHSPPPLQTAFEGIGKAMLNLNRIGGVVIPGMRAPSLSAAAAPVSLPSSEPLLSRSARQGALASSGGGGHTINVADGAIRVTEANDPHATARAVRDELIKHGKRNAGQLWN